MEILELEPQAGQVAELLSAMAHEKRLLILCHLTKGEQSVSALAEKLELPQPTLSQHLAKLRDLKLVATRREGNVVHYHLASSQVEEVLCALHSAYCHTSGNDLQGGQNTAAQDNREPGRTDLRPDV